MTLKEIAKEANVSISTVSRVINQKKHKSCQSRSTRTHLEHREKKWIYA